MKGHSLPVVCRPHRILSRGRPDKTIEQTPAPTEKTWRLRCAAPFAQATGEPPVKEYTQQFRHERLWQHSSTCRCGSI